VELAATTNEDDTEQSVTTVRLYSLQGQAATTTQPGIEDLYREHALGLVRFALLLTGGRATAEDVVQDAFLGLHRHWGRGQGSGPRPGLPAHRRGEWQRVLLSRRLLLLTV
jgi:hypothetical protein